MGSKIVFFGGGGRDQSNEIVVLDLLPSQERLQNQPLLQSSETSVEEVDKKPPASTTTTANSSSSLSSSVPSAPQRNFFLYKPTLHSYQRTPNQSRSPGIHRTYFSSPIPRCSAVSVQFGRCLFYFGGWNQRRDELSDLWVT